MSISAKLHDTKRPYKIPPEVEQKIRAVLKKYPEHKHESAIMPVLDLVQRDNGGWLSRAALEQVAARLQMPFLKVWEIASFYSMYYLAPIGKYLIQVCRTTPCWLCGSSEVLRACRDKLGIDVGETTPDKMFTLVEVECLGACVNAPMVQINDDYAEDLSYERMLAILERLKRGGQVAHGTQVDRLNSAPAGGLTVLKESHASAKGGDRDA